MERKDRNAALRKAKIKTQIMLGIVGSATLDKILKQIKYETNTPKGITSKQYYDLLFVYTLSNCIYGKPYTLESSLLTGCYPVMIQALYNCHRSTIINDWLNSGDRAMHTLYAQTLEQVRLEHE